jgi:hypothetical protein
MPPTHRWSEDQGNNWRLKYAAWGGFVVSFYFSSKILLERFPLIRN